MSAPEHVRASPLERPRTYRAPRWRSVDWRPSRPGDLRGPNPRGEGFGWQGPDQGYALKLARSLQDSVRLAPDERWDDVEAGCAQVAIRRASLFGRAPVIHDLEVSFALWGFFEDPAEVPRELLDLRRRVFDEVADAHHAHELHRVDDLVAEDALRLDPAEVRARFAENWQSWISAPRGEGAMPPPGESAAGDGADEHLPKRTVKKVVKKVVRKVRKKPGRTPGEEPPVES